MKYSKKEKVILERLGAFQLNEVEYNWNSLASMVEKNAKKELQDAVKKFSNDPATLRLHKGDYLDFMEVVKLLKKKDIENALDMAQDIGGPAYYIIPVKVWDAMENYLEEQ